MPMTVRTQDKFGRGREELVYVAPLIAFCEHVLATQLRRALFASHYSTLTISGSKCTEECLTRYRMHMCDT